MRLPNDRVLTLPRVLDYWAASTPDAAALASPGREPTTYRALHEAVARVADHLRALGLSRNDRIALLLPEGPDYSLALLAAISVGVAVPLTWPAPWSELNQLIASGRVSALLVSAAIPWPDNGLADAGLPVVTLTSHPAGSVGDVRFAGRAPSAPTARLPAEADDVAIIFRTSGTTGRPKWVPMTHRAIDSSCRAMIAARGLGPADRCLSPVRAAYSQGFHALVIPLFAGATIVGLPEFDLASLPRWLAHFRPTYLSVAPAILRLLASDDGDVRKALHQAPLRCINSTAGALSVDEIEILESRLGAAILNTYGMTEAPAIAGEWYGGKSRIPGSLGRPWCDLRILGPDREPAPAGESGEIVVRGPRVFPGYLDDPETSAAAFLPGGWFRTGDVGCLDAEGCLHLTGRLGEVINRGGEKIAPGEVDIVLRSHPAVADAAVFATPDARLGEDIVAAVVPREGVDLAPRDVRAWVRTRLARYKAPRRIWLVDELPRTPTGKVQRGELARRWLQERG